MTNYEKSSRISIMYNSNKIREPYVAYNKKKFQASFTSSMVNGYRGYSLNKIDSSKQHPAKIDVIKLKCFQTPKLLGKTASKQITTTGKYMEGDDVNTSYDL